MEEKILMDGGMPLNDLATWNIAKKKFEINIDLNAHDKANLTAMQPIKGFPEYDFISEFLNNMDKKVEY